MFRFDLVNNAVTLCKTEECCFPQAVPLFRLAPDRSDGTLAIIADLIVCDHFRAVPP